MKHYPKNSRHIAEQAIAVVEKVLGTGLDPTTDRVLVSELTALLEENLARETLFPAPVPDAHLEMTFEDRISGSIE